MHYGKILFINVFLRGNSTELIFRLLFSTFPERMPSFIFKVFAVGWHGVAFLDRGKNINKEVIYSPLSNAPKLEFS